MYSAELQNVLRESGWTPERRCDVSTWIEVLAQEGYAPLLEATAILRNFATLRLYPAARRRERWAAPFSLVFDPLTASGDFSRVREYQDRLHLQFFPIAYTCVHGPLFLADNHKIYADVDLLNPLARSFEQLLQRLLLNHTNELEAAHRDRTAI